MSSQDISAEEEKTSTQAAFKNATDDAEWNQKKKMEEVDAYII